MLLLKKKNKKKKMVHFSSTMITQIIMEKFIYLEYLQSVPKWLKLELVCSKKSLAGLARVGSETKSKSEGSFPWARKSFQFLS